MNIQEKITRVAVRAIICDEYNRALIIKRANTQYGNNRWCLPGGKVDFGVSALETLAKEIQEETSLQCLNSEFISFIDTLPTPESNEHYISLVFKCEVTGKVILNDESQEFKWITYSQLKDYSLVFENDKALKNFWENKTK